MVLVGAAKAAYYNGKPLSAIYLGWVKVWPPIPPNPQFLGWWNFDCSPSPIVPDLSGHGNHLTVKPNKNYGSGYDQGNALTGNTGTLNLFSGADVKQFETPSRSFTCWTVPYGAANVLRWVDAATGATVFGFGGTTWGITARWQTASGAAADSGDIRPNVTIVSTSWIHVGVVYDHMSGKLSLYMNGVLKWSGAVGPAGTLLAAATAIELKGNSTSCRIDDLKIYGSAISRDQVLADMAASGPMGAWNFDDPSAIKVSDLSKHGNDLKVTTAMYVPGRNGGSAISSPVLTQLKYLDTRFNTDGQTLACWVKLGSAATDVFGFADVDNEIPRLIFDTVVNGAQYGIKCKYWVSPSVRSLVAYATHSGWAHVALVRDEKLNLSIYFDGKLAATQVMTGSTNYTVELCIGGGVPVDDVRIYGQALTAAQVVADMNTVM